MYRESFIFYRSFYEAIEKIRDDAEKLEAYRALVGFALGGEVPENLGPSADIVFTLARPQLEANNKRAADGSKGGRPKTNGNKTNNAVVISEKKPRLSKIKTSGFENEKPNVNENVNVNVNENENVVNTAPAPADPSPVFPHGLFLNVMLTPEQESELVKKYGREQADKYIERLSAYMANTGKTYKDHYRTILGWIKQDGVPEVQTKVSDLYTRAMQIDRKAKGAS